MSEPGFLPTHPLPPTVRMTQPSCSARCYRDNEVNFPGPRTFGPPGASIYRIPISMPVTDEIFERLRR